MVSKSLFATARRELPADALNHEGAPAYAHGPEAALAQFVATGTLADNFYTTAETQLTELLATLATVDPLFIAQCAIYARTAGAMKDMPALLTAYLTVADPDLALRVFPRVIDTGRMLRNFVQIMRSGRIGRRSLGTRPKRLVQNWLERATLRDLLAAATGKDPSLADIVKMVHPKPADATRRAFYGWLIGRPYDVAALPEEIAAFEAWKRAPADHPLPPVPFEWLTTHELTAENWSDLAGRIGWQALRQNLNSLARHGAFAVAGTTERVAARLSDPAALQAVRPLPHQVLMALGELSPEVPAEIRAALEQALDQALAHVPTIHGRLTICPDLSGSMRSPVTGYRKGSSSKTTCLDVATMIAAAFLRTNRKAKILPFHDEVVQVELDPAAPLAANAGYLAKLDSGGTNISAPLVALLQRGVAPDLVVLISDNESWIDAGEGRSGKAPCTAALAAWEKLVQRNPRARLVCIDLTPNPTTQVPGRKDILNVGGFSGAVFATIHRFVSKETPDWISLIKAITV